MCYDEAMTSSESLAPVAGGVPLFKVQSGSQPGRKADKVQGEAGKIPESFRINGLNFEEQV